MFLKLRVFIRSTSDKVGRAYVCIGFRLVRAQGVQACSRLSASGFPPHQQALLGPGLHTGSSLHCALKTDSRAYTFEQAPQTEVLEITLPVKE